MNIKCKPMGLYQTNCYIVEIEGKELIIDPGVGAASWVMDNVHNPIAILNTHGHFDHVWSNGELKEQFNIPLYTPASDVFMLANDPFAQGTPPSEADVIVQEDEDFSLCGIDFSYLFFPGHTPGCSAILIQDTLFSGDFIFKGSIGRVDFPYSSPEEMRESIVKFLKLKNDWKIFPGHGGSTSVFAEQKTLPMWLDMI